MYNSALNKGPDLSRYPTVVMTSIGSTVQQARSQSNLVRWFLLLITAQLLAMTFIAPYLLSRGNVVESGAIYYLGSLVSTRVTVRTYFAFDFPLAVDARALGILCGALISLSAYSRLSMQIAKSRESRLGRIALQIVPVIIASVFAIDVFVGYSLGSGLINAMFAIGLLFGLPIPFYLVPVVCWTATLPGKLGRIFATARPTSS